ncbi:MAG: alpha/beta fold hydrolase [Chitinophagales bacterium]
MNGHSDLKKGYSVVNGLNMYYEIRGHGKPLVLIHGGGSTIQTSFGNIIPFLSEKRQVIALELQAHGRTADRKSSLTFAQDANDVAQLLKYLNIQKADFLGFSNGGHTLIELAMRHTQIINKIILASTFYKRDAAVPAFWTGFDHVTLSVMPKALQDGFLAVNNNQTALQNMFDKDVQRMKAFEDWTDEQIRSIKSPTLIMNGNQDVGSIEHAVLMHRMISNSELVILPGGHGQYLGTIESLENGEWTRSYAVGIIEEFLDK